jgi:hypothetical protein
MLRYMAVALVVLGLCCAQVAWGAEAKNPEKAAQDAAQRWLELVDAGRYVQSWGDAAAIFRTAVPPQEWATKVGAVRDPLGPVVSRKQQSAQYTTALPGAPDGQYVVIQYDTVFAHKASAVETVTTMLDKDHWRVTGYFIR